MVKCDKTARMPRHRFVAVNRVELTGHLSHDAELRYTSDGTPACQIQIGVSAPLKGTKGKRTTVFVQVACFRDVALRASQLRKGLPVWVEGRLMDNRYLAGTRWVRSVKVYADSVLRMTLDEAEGVILCNTSGDEGCQSPPGPRSRRARTTAAAPVPADPPTPAKPTRKRRVIRDSGDLDAG